MSLEQIKTTIDNAWKNKRLTTNWGQLEDCVRNTLRAVRCEGMGNATAIHLIDDAFAAFTGRGNELY